MDRMTGKEALSLFAGFIVGVVAILALVSLPLALERNKWKGVAEEQADTISRYEAITAGYEELTAELFEMLEGGNEMSVLIRGMQMPSECRMCPLCRYFSSVGVTICIVTQATLAEDYKVIRFDGRHEKCPLVELPEKHGRLVDADAYVSMMEGKCDYEKALDPYVLSVCRGGIKLMPTIVEAEGAEGEW